MRLRHRGRPRSHHRLIPIFLQYISPLYPAVVCPHPAASGLHGYTLDRPLYIGQPQQQGRYIFAERLSTRHLILRHALSQFVCHALLRMGVRMAGA